MPKLVFARSLIALAGLVASLVWGPAANANSVGILVCQAGFGCDAPVVDFPIPGVSSYTSPWGTFDTNTISGTGNPPLSGTALLSSTSLNVSSVVGGELFVYVSETGLSVAGLTQFLNSFTSNVGPAGGLVSVTESVYVDATNAMFALTTLIATKTFFDIGSDSQLSAPFAFGGPFSLTHLYDIIVAPGGSSNATIFSAAAPVPAALPLFASVLGGGFLLLRRRSKPVAIAA